MTHKNEQICRHCLPIFYDFFTIFEMHKNEKIPMSSRLFGIILVNWWLRGDSNPRHFGYEPNALTNWATQP